MIDYDYKERIEFLINFQSNSKCEIDDKQEKKARSLFIFLEKTEMHILVIIPNESTNVNDLIFFGFDRGKTLAAIKEGFSDEQIRDSISNMIELEDEANAVNFICGDRFFRKNEKAIPYIEKLLEKYS